MPFRKFVVAFVLTVSPLLMAQSPSPTTDAILARLDKLERQNAELLAEIRSLRSELSKQAPQAANPSEQPVSERQDVSEQRIRELAQTKVEASQKFPIQLTGMALFNAFVNGRNSGGDQDPTAAALLSGSHSSGASFRQTVLGLKFDGPTTLLGGAVSGSLFMDFFGGDASSLNHLLRLRVATVQVDWPNLTFAVGQDKPLVSQREPNSLAQVGVSPLTGAGNPWLWQPQARLQYHFHLSGNTEIAPEGGLFLTAENVNDSEYAPTRFEPARPAFETRIPLRHRFTESKLFELAPVFHTSTSHAGGLSIPSRLFGVDWLIKPFDKLEITGLLFRGENIANLGALGGINFRDPGIATAVRGSGGWVQFRYLATRKLTFDFYAGQQDNFSRDLLASQIGKNQYYAANAIYLLAPNVLASFEAGQNRTSYFSAGNRLNNHYDLALAYLF